MLVDTLLEKTLVYRKLGLSQDTDIHHCHDGRVVSIEAVSPIALGMNPCKDN